MRLALVALVAVRLLAAGDPASDFFPPNTKVVFGVRVPAIVESSLFKDAGTGAQQFSQDWLKVVAITGFDPLHDIDEILLASPADNEKAAALLVLRGRFDLARLEHWSWPLPWRRNGGRRQGCEGNTGLAGRVYHPDRRHRRCPCRN